MATRYVRMALLLLRYIRNRMEYILSTERLKLRYQDEHDAPFIYELMNSEGWIKNIGDRNIRSFADAAAYITNISKKSYIEHGFGFYLVCLKDGDIPIGICGLAKRPALEHADIGFAFLPQYEKKGYGVESANAVMGYARDVLDMITICAITLPENKPSVQLLTRLGLTVKQKFVFPGETEELLLFERSLV